MTLKEIQARHPLWHPYRTQPSGHLWASTDHWSEGGGPGMTVDATTPEGLEAKIADVERNPWLVAA